MRYSERRRVQGDREVLRPGPRLKWGLDIREPSYVVLSELPEVPETLFLRMMGAGKTLQRAIAELAALPPDAPEYTLAMPVLLRYRLGVPSDPKQRTSEDEEFLMSTQDIVEAWEQEKIKAGHTAGHTEGLREGLKIGLKEAITETYEARFGAMPADLAAIVREMSDESAFRGLLKLIVAGTPEQIRDRLLSTRASS